MADNKKQEKDFTKEVDALIPEAESIIKVCESHLYIWISHIHSSPLSLVSFKMVWTSSSRSRSKQEMLGTNT